MFVTTYSNKDVGDSHTFIRLNRSLSGAMNEAMLDASVAIGEYETQNGTQEIDCVEGEGDDPTIIRIIHPTNGYEYEPTNGYEYEAYIIEEHIVSD